MYIFDSTTISLFHDVLRAGGLTPASGKHKGGIKVHTLLRADHDVPCMVNYSSGVASDSAFLKQVDIPAGSIIVFDRGYYNFKTFNRFSADNITWITRLRHNFAFDVIADLPAGPKKNIARDQGVLLGYKRKTRMEARLITIQYLAFSGQ